MIITIICFISIFVSIIFEVESDSNISKKMVFISTLATISCMVIMTYDQCNYEYVETSKVNIIALQDNRGIEGYGSRYYAKLNSTQDITLAIGNKDNYRIWNIDSSLCDIYEGDYKKPYVVIETAYALHNSFLEPIFGRETNNHRYKIYIPEGTLIENYKIDLN